MGMSKKDKKKLIRDGVDFGIEALGFPRRTSFLRNLRTFPIYFLYDSEGISGCDTFRPLIRLLELIYNIRGNETMLYKCYAVKQGLSRPILSFPPEPIIQVLYHEMFHNANNYYSDNESYADAIGFSASMEFAKQNSRLDFESLVQSEKTFGELANFISGCIEGCKTSGLTKGELRDKNKKLHEIIAGFDGYHFQRFNYPFNKAFLARVGKYCLGYECAKRTISSHTNISDFLHKDEI